MLAEQSAQKRKKQKQKHRRKIRQGENAHVRWLLHPEPEAAMLSTEVHTPVMLPTK